MKQRFYSMMLTITLLLSMIQGLTVQAATDGPAIGNIYVSNNKFGVNDSVLVESFEPGDILKVYNVATGGTAIGTATVPDNSNFVNISIAQLGAIAGNIYVSAIRTWGPEIGVESDRTTKAYLSETSAPAIAGNITVVNNKLGVDDTVTVTGLLGDDVVKVFSATSGGTLLGTDTVDGFNYETSAYVEIPQIGAGTGSIYVSITSKDKYESTRVAKAFISESTVALSVNQISVFNNFVGVADSVDINGLVDGDIVKVYSLATGGTTLGSGVKTGSTSSVSISIEQLGVSLGNIYVTLTTENKTESIRVKKSYSSEITVTPPLEGNVVVENNYIDGLTNKDDKVIFTSNVTTLLEDEIVKVYRSSTGGTALGSATVIMDQILGKIIATVTVPQLGIEAGTIYVSRIGLNGLESTRSAVTYSAEPKSDSPSLSDVQITNRPGSNDTIIIGNFPAPGKVIIYTAATGGTLFADFYAGENNVTWNLPNQQVGVTAGTLYVAFKHPFKQESARTAIPFLAEPITSAPLVGNINVVNNKAGTGDTVTVSGLLAGDIVKVYSVATGSTAIGLQTVTTEETTAVVNIDQMGIAAGNIYVSVVTEDKNESPRTTKSYLAEISTAPDAVNLQIMNYAGKSDTITYTGKAGDVIKIYRDGVLATVLGSGTIAVGKTTAVINIAQLGGASGSIYATLTCTSERESTTRTKVDYVAEVKSTTLDTETNGIVITNKTGSADTIVVGVLQVGDVIKVYKDAVTTKVLGTATVAVGGSIVTVSILQLGQVASKAYISVTKPGKLESTRLEVDYVAEGKATAPATSSFVVVNNAGISDTVTFTGQVGDTIKIYKDGSTTTVLGTGKVGVLKTNTIISIAQIGSASGSVYATLTTATALESEIRTKIDFVAEVKSTKLDEETNGIVITNKTGSTDTIAVDSLTVGDIIKVYSDATTTKTLGLATVAVGANSVSINVTQLGQIAGKAYISITNKTKQESDRIAVDYVAEVKASAPAGSSFVVVNNAGMSDTITYTGQVGDTIKVYKDGAITTVLGTAKIAALKTTAVISIAQIGAMSGSIYVTLTTATALESATRTEIEYIAEVKSIALDDETSTIVITNKTGSSDTISIDSLEVGDIIKVYSDATITKTLGLATVAVGANSVIVSIAQLGQVAGKAYISITNKTKQESDRITVDYVAEGKATAPASSSFVVVNNAGISDTITYTGQVGDTIKIYKDGTITTVLGTGKVGALKTTTVISIAQIGSASGSIYATLTTATALESEIRTKIDYVAEVKSTQLDEETNSIIVTNKTGSSDTIAVGSLAVGDMIIVYKDATLTKSLGLSTVAIGGNSVIVSITQLGQAAGSVYISVTNKTKLESDKIAVEYIAEVKAAPPADSSLVVVNNAGMSDTITYTGSAGDIIKVYRDNASTTVLGTATVAALKTTAVISIAQIGATSGSLYVTLTTATALESATRTKINYVDEVKSDVLDDETSTIVITNKTGSSDTISIDSLAVGDIIKVYSDATITKTIGLATVAVGANSVIVSIAQLGQVAGKAYISITNKTKQESDRIAVDYIAEAKASAPAASSFAIVNNATVGDSIIYTGSAGDIIKVYRDNTSTTALGTGTVAALKTTAMITISQLGSSSGSIYVTLANSTGLESLTRTKVDYLAEAQSADLTGLVISGTPGNYTFAGSTYSYTGVTVGNSVSTITITPTGAGFIKVGTTTIASGATSATIALTAGVEKTITVTATESGKVTKTYTIKVTRATASTFTVSSKTIAYDSALTSDPTSDNEAVATAVNGSLSIIITSVSAGTAKITINGNDNTYILVTVASNGTITVPGNTYFTVDMDNGVDNGALGIITSNAISSSPAVATVVVNGTALEITSVKPGTSTITASNASGDEVDVPVTVANDGTITIGSFVQFGSFAVHTDNSILNNFATLGYVGTTLNVFPKEMTPGVTADIVNGKIEITSVTPGTWVSTTCSIRIYKEGDTWQTATNYAIIYLHVNSDGSIVIDGIIKGDQTFVASTLTVTNDMATLGLVGTLATGGGHPTLVNGNIVINASSIGDVGLITINVGDGTGDMAKINGIINADGSITIKSIDKYLWAFYSHRDFTTLNDIDTLGLVGVTVTSDDEEVATVKFIVAGSRIQIDTLKEGTFTITVTDADANIATIEVTSGLDGRITIGTITKYVA